MNVGRTLMVIAVISSLLLFMGLASTNPSFQRSLNTVFGNPHSQTYYAWINFTRAGTVLPSGTRWGGTVLETQGEFPGTLITFSAPSTATYQNVTLDVYDFPANETYTLTPIGPVNGNHYYQPRPNTGTLTAYTPSSKTLDVTVNYTEISGYPVNITEYTLPLGMYFNGSIANRLAIGNITDYFSTHANSFSVILPNGTYFLNLNNSSGFGGLYAPYQKVYSFAVMGASYSLTVTYVDVTPNQYLKMTFLEHGLPNGTAYYFIVNGTRFDENASSNIVYTTLPVGISQVYASAPGYDYVGKTAINVEQNAGTFYLNFTQQNSSADFGLVGGFNSLLNPLGITINGFLIAITLLAGFLVSAAVYAGTREIMIASGVYVGILWAATGFSIIPLSIPFVAMFAAIAAFMLEKRTGGIMA